MPSGWRLIPAANRRSVTYLHLHVVLPGSPDEGRCTVNPSGDLSDYAALFANAVMQDSEFWMPARTWRRKLDHPLSRDPAVGQMVANEFAVGFAIAFAARTFARLTMIVVGVFLLALFGLEYVEVVTVNWDKMQGHYDSFLASTRASFGGFGDFITGRLPSAASALAGLVIGFRKR